MDGCTVVLPLASIYYEQNKDTKYIFVADGVNYNGGSSTYCCLWGMTLDKDNVITTNPLDLGDRVIVKSAVVKNDTITINAIIHGKGEAACCPKTKAILKYKIQDNHLIKLDNNNDGEITRKEFIPKTYDDSNSLPAQANNPVGKDGLSQQELKHKGNEALEHAQSANNSLLYLSKYEGRLPDALKLNSGNAGHPFDEKYDSIWDDPGLSRVVERDLGRNFVNKVTERHRGTIRTWTDIINKGNILMVAYCRQHNCGGDNVRFFIDMEKGDVKACIHGFEDFLGIKRSNNSNPNDDYLITNKNKQKIGVDGCDKMESSFNNKLLSQINTDQTRQNKNRGSTIKDEALSQASPGSTTHPTSTTDSYRVGVINWTIIDQISHKLSPYYAQLPPGAAANPSSQDLKIFKYLAVTAMKAAEVYSKQNNFDIIIVQKRLTDHISHGTPLIRDELPYFNPSKVNDFLQVINGPNGIAYAKMLNTTNLDREIASTIDSMN